MSCSILRPVSRLAGDLLAPLRSVDPGGSPGRRRLYLRSLQFGALCLTILSGSALSAQELDTFDIQAQPGTDRQSAVVNEFICNSDSFSRSTTKTVPINEGTVVARMLTALNSRVSQRGDLVVAAGSDPVKGPLAAALPVGTLLRGYVDASNHNGRMRHDGQILFKFYCAETGGRRLELTLRLANDDGIMHPLKYSGRPTGKQCLRNLLMMSSKIAIPLAIGSGGMSLAITTGAGAIIGGVLADDHRYLQGAARGAWQGAGLNVFDPLVCKGKEVVIPWGTRITLQLAEPVELPRSTTLAGTGSPPETPGGLSKASFAFEAPEFFSRRPILSTSAQLIDRRMADKVARKRNDKTAKADDPLAGVREMLAEKNLAGAMQALDQAMENYPNDPRVAAERDELIPLVTGQRP